MKKKNKIIIAIASVVAVLAIALTGAGYYFYTVAVVPGHKAFLSNKKPLQKSDPLYQQKLWYKNAKKQKWTMKAAGANLKLDANYIKASQPTEKTAIILHGYMNSKDDMGAYASLFHNLGYNVLMPDARAHGQSQGKTIGYGWMEKDDVRKWAQKIVTTNGKKSNIVIFGVSMGGATAMMTSGLTLPTQVKAIIEDCGYTNVKTELEHEAQAFYNIPAVPRFPLVEIVSGFTRINGGYFLNDGDATKQLGKNHLPILFIHGGKDNFVPTKMVYNNYRADHGPKEIWIAPNAGHAESYAKYPKKYQTEVEQFLNKYDK